MGIGDYDKQRPNVPLPVPEEQEPAAAKAQGPAAAVPVAPADAAEAAPQKAMVPLPTATAVRPQPKPLPTMIPFSATFPAVPVLDAEGKPKLDKNGDAIFVRMNPSGSIRAQWPTAWYREQLQTAKRQGIDPYFYLAAQLLEFPGGYSKQSFKISPSSLNLMSATAVNLKVHELVKTEPTPVARLAAVKTLEALADAMPQMSARLLKEVVSIVAGPPVLDEGTMSAADRARAEYVMEKAFTMSGADLINMTGAASGCLAGDAAYSSGNLAKVQPQIRKLAADMKVPLSKLNGHDFINIGDPRATKAAHIQSFYFLKLHQEEIAAALKNGTPPSQAFQLFNGMGNRPYHRVDGKHELLQVNGKTSATYGATMLALMMQMHDPNNAQYAQIRDLVTAVYGEDFAPLTQAGAEKLDSDPFRPRS